jgi:hypothetical protein
VIVLAAAAKSTSAWDQPGTLGFLVVFGMGVVLYFVFRSMAKQLRKVREAAWKEQDQAERAQADAMPGVPQDDGGQPVASGRVAGRGAQDRYLDDYDRQQREDNAIDLDF